MLGYPSSAPLDRAHSLNGWCGKGLTDCSGAVNAVAPHFGLHESGLCRLSEAYNSGKNGIPWRALPGRPATWLRRGGRCANLQSEVRFGSFGCLQDAPPFLRRSGPVALWGRPQPPPAPRPPHQRRFWAKTKAKPPPQHRSAASRLLPKPSDNTAALMQVRREANDMDPSVGFFTSSFPFVPCSSFQLRLSCCAGEGRLALAWR